MSRQTVSHQNSDASGEHTVTKQLDFSTLYDRYAPALLGVITRIVSDKDESIRLLESTFMKVRLEINQFNAEKQPVFAWLLNIARKEAAEFLNQREKGQTAVFELSANGKVMPLQKNTTPAPRPFRSDLTDPRLTELVDSVLFENCTPEEAAGSVGFPVELARQQLRRAVQQLRASSGS